jgi:hypothetical protein
MRRERRSAMTKCVAAEKHSIDYRLNRLGIRVWTDSCQLIARHEDNWRVIGLQRSLPVYLSKEQEEGFVDPLDATALQYAAENPGSDLVDVLCRHKPFAAALENTAA